MNDVALYKHIEKYCDVQADGKCFVSAFNYESFVTGLNIRYEHDFDAHICTGGNICFSLQDVCDLFADNPDSLYDEIMKEIE